MDDLLANIRRSVDNDIDSLSGGTTSQSRGTLMRGALREMRVNLGVEPSQAAKAENEISDLRSRIRQKMASMEAEPYSSATRGVPPPPPPAVNRARAANAVVPARHDFSGIMAGPPPSPRQAPLRGSFAHQDTADDLRYAPPPPPPPQAYWQEPEQQAYAPEPDPFAQQPYDPAYGYEEQGYANQAYQPQLEAPIMSPHTEAHAETAFRQLSDAILARATGDRSLEEMTREMLKGMLKQWLDANLPSIVEDMVREEIQRVARRGR